MLSRGSGATQELVRRKRGTPFVQGPPARVTSQLGTSWLCLAPPRNKI